MISASTLEEAFPSVEPGVKPFGARVLVQFRTVRNKTESGIVLVDDTKQYNRAATQLAKILSLGPIAYCNRDTGLPWREGVWAEVGTFVRVPRYGGDRFDRVNKETGETMLFGIFSDHEIIAGVDPTAFEELDEIL